MRPFDPSLPIPLSIAEVRLLVYRLTTILRDLQSAIDLLSYGYLAGSRYTATAAPTSGSAAKGDQVRNSNPSEAGSAPNKYVIVGWICVADGSPGTWREMRVLTGN